MKYKIIDIFDHPLNDSISADSTVLDIGGHVGKFAGIIIERYGANVVSYEPLDRYIEPLKELEKKYPNKFTYHKKAVWKKNGKVTIYDYSCRANSIIQRIDRGKRRKLKGKIVVPCVTLKDALEKINNISYVKINIEGAEIEVLASTPDNALLNCPQLSISFHTWIGDKFKNKRTNEQVSQIVERFKKLGFHAHKYNDRPDYLFINEII